MTVIGTGYLGATHAVCMASLGFNVLGLDVDEAKVAALSAGNVPFFEPGLPELLREQLASGRLRFTSSWQEVGDFGDVHFVCVGTPQKKGEMAADLTYVYAAFNSLVEVASHGSVLVGKSTVPAGTAAALSLIAATRTDLRVVWNPEFLREGFAVADTLHPDRLVFGVEAGDAWGEQALRDAFAPILAAGTPVVVTDLATVRLQRTLRAHNAPPVTRRGRCAPRTGLRPRCPSGMLTAWTSGGWTRTAWLRSARPGCPPPALEDYNRVLPSAELDGLWARRGLSLRDRTLFRLLYETTARAQEGAPARCRGPRRRAAPRRHGLQGRHITRCTTRPAQPDCCPGCSTDGPEARSFLPLQRR